MATTSADPAAPPKDPNSEEIDVTDDLGRKRVYYTDGRKVPKPKDEKYQEFDAYWVESYRLVAEYDGSHGARVTRSYEPAPGGKQLYETVRLERTRSYGPVEIRYVYDLAPEHIARSERNSAGIQSVSAAMVKWFSPIALSSRTASAALPRRFPAIAPALRRAITARPCSLHFTATVARPRRVTAAETAVAVSATPSRVSLPALVICDSTLKPGALDLCIHWNSAWWWRWDRFWRDFWGR